jgi:hypothetical protein
MDERLHASLDGELPPADLTPAERTARAAFDARTAGLRADLGQRVPAGIDTSVMRRIRDQGLEPLPALAEPLLRRVASSAWKPRDIRLHMRPVYGMAAAAVLAALLMAGGALLSDAVVQPAQPVASTQPTASVPAGAIYVQFRLDAGTASNVSLAGSFSDWQPAHRMQQSVDGIWTVLLPLEAGVHDYGFVVYGADGEQWVADPYAPQVDDGFGGVNSRLTVLPPADRL